jgi:hypothetical protein
MFQLTPDKWICLAHITLVIDRGYADAKRRVRIYTTDGKHEYDLTNEQYTHFMCKIKEMEIK